MSTNLPAIAPISEIRAMADAFAKSKLFGIQNVEQAMALMLIAQAEGNHPAIAARDYHIIQGKPALKADAMMARFQSAGGKVEWVDMTDEKVSAYFSHAQGGRVLIDWTLARAKQAQLGGNGMWSKYPRQMLRARVISEGIRTVFPGVIVGSYTEEEVQDITTIDVPATQVQTVPNLSMAIDRERAEQVYNQALKNIAACDSLESLQKTWRGYAKTLRTMPEDLAADMIQKKDEMKAELSGVPDAQPEGEAA